MDEKQLIGVALASSLLGIVSLFVICIVDSPKPFTGTEDGKVRLSGTIIQIEHGDKVSRLTVASDNQDVCVAFFSSPLQELEEGMKVDVEAEVSTFRGKKELLAYRITASG